MIIKKYMYKKKSYDKITITEHTFEYSCMINIFMYQGSILSTKMVAWATKFHLRLPKFKSGGQHDHQHN